MEYCIYQVIAQRFEAMRNCENSDNDMTDAHEAHKEALKSIMGKYAPHGSGIDSGVHLNLYETSEINPNKIMMYFSYHFMNENGMYDGWEDYTLIIRPSLAHGFELKINGKNRDDIKDYFYDLFDTFLREKITY